MTGHAGTSVAEPPVLKCRKNRSRLMEFQELVHGDFGRRLLQWICSDELLALHASSSQIVIPSLELQAAVWVGCRKHWLLHNEAIPPMEMSKVAQLFSSWPLQGAKMKSSLSTCLGCGMHEDTSLCCWPVVRKLAFKQQYILRLPGAPELDIVDVDREGLLCLALDSCLERRTEDGTLSMRTFLVGACAGGILVLRHILESCPHSGLEHSTQVILAEGTAQLTEHFKAQPDRLLQDMMTLPAEEHTFVSILNADPILEAVDEFCAQFAMD